MLDFHNHIIPGVDDGAQDLAQAGEALGTMVANGIHAIILTPHFEASLTHRPGAMLARLAEIDAAYGELRELAAREYPELRLERGVELMLDDPDPVLDDPRLRLAGTSYLLLEFPMMQVPPNSAEAIRRLRGKGITPIIAHPERYGGLERNIELAGEWRAAGAHLQVNCGSLVGRYGPAPREVALDLLARGWVDYLCSDYHARGRLLVRSAREMLESMGGGEQAAFLMVANPLRLLDDQAPWPVMPVARRSTFLSRVRTFLADIGKSPSNPSVW